MTGDHGFRIRSRSPQTGHTSRNLDVSARSEAMPSVLIVDDDDQIRSLLRLPMEQAGYEVSEGRSGREGLQRYRSAPVDLVIMDILMPDKDGLEAIIELRREFPDAKIIAMTGGNTQMNAPLFLDVAKLLGATRTLQKPFSIEEFLTTVEAELTPCGDGGSSPSPRVGAG